MEAGAKEQRLREHAIPQMGGVGLTMFRMGLGGEG